MVYEYANGMRAYSFCRQQAGCWNDTTDTFMGTKGMANMLGGNVIKDRAGKTIWKFDPKTPRPACTMPSTRHCSPRSAPASRSTTASTWRAARCWRSSAAWSPTRARRLTWEDAINSKEDLSPQAYTWEADPPVKPDKDGKYPVALPGITKFA